MNQTANNTKYGKLNFTKKLPKMPVKINNSSS